MRQLLPLFFVFLCISVFALTPYIMPGSEDINRGKYGEGQATTPLNYSQNPKNEPVYSINNVFPSLNNIDFVSDGNITIGLDKKNSKIILGLNYDLNAFIIDSNTLFIKVSDSNNIGRLNYQVIANPPWLTVATNDTNWQTSFPLFDSNMALRYYKQSDANVVLQKVSDTNNTARINYKAIADLNSAYYSQKDANSVFAKYSFGTNNFSGDGNFVTTGYGRFDKGILAIGGTNGFVVPSGSGVRFMWIPEKWAIRAGYVDNLSGGQQWDNANIGYGSTAFGINTIASKVDSFAVGTNTTASGDGAAVFGDAATASGFFSLAAGDFTVASGRGSVALGLFTDANGEGSFVTGLDSNASNNFASAFGNATHATGIASTAFGDHTIASGTGSTSSGGYATALGDYSTAIGGSSYASGYSSVAMGGSVIASGTGSVSLGYGGKATNIGSIAAGFNDNGGGLFESNGFGSIALGYAALDENLLSNGTGSVSIGYSTNALADYSTAIGHQAIASHAGEIALADDVRIKNYLTVGSNVNDTNQNIGEGDINITGKYYGDGSALKGISSLPADFNGQYYSQKDANSVFVPYVGATKNVNLGDKNIITTGFGEFDKGILAQGATTGYVVPSGMGERFMWIPDKYAFRVGKVDTSGSLDTTVWDYANIGSGSIAMGNNGKASGQNSIVIASLNPDQTGSITASGKGSIIMGFGEGDMLASDLGSKIFGYTENSDASISSTSRGSTVIGYVADSGILASGYGSTVIGYRGGYGGAMSATNTGSTVIGACIGEESVLTSTASGSTAMGVSTTGDNGAGNITASGSGSVAMGSSNDGGALTSSGLGSVAMGSATTDGSIISAGAGSVAIGNINNGSIFSNGYGTVAIGEATSDGMYVGGSGSIGMGSAQGNHPITSPISASISSIGIGAVSLGVDNKAFGNGAVSIGFDNNANGNGAVAIGSNCFAKTTNSVAIGLGAVSNKSGLVTLAIDVNVARDLNVSRDTNISRNLKVDQNITVGNVLHGQIDWIYTIIGMAGNTACNNLDGKITNYTYTCQTCVDTAGTTVSCGTTLVTLNANCACKVD